MKDPVLLKTGAGPECGMQRVRSFRAKKGDLPKVGMVVREGCDPAGKGLAATHHKDLEALVGQKSAQGRGLAVRVIASQVKMGGDKSGAVDDPRIHSFLDEPPAPKGFGDIHLDSGSVSLVPDLPGPMLHLLKGLESLVNEAMGGASIPGENRDHGAAVPLLIGKGSREARNVFGGRDGGHWGYFLDGKLRGIRIRGHRSLPSLIVEPWSRRGEGKGATKGMTVIFFFWSCSRIGKRSEIWM